MTGVEFKRRVFDLKFTAGLNARYHHAYEHYYGRWDRAIRIGVGVFAVAALPFAFQDVPPWGVVSALVAVAAALVLNIVPVADWQKTHGELFRSWSDLREDADILDMGCCDMGDDKEVQDHEGDRLTDLTGKAHRLNATEPIANRKFLVQCMEDETEAVYGKGVRTPEDVAAVTSTA